MAARAERKARWVQMQQDLRQWWMDGGPRVVLYEGTQNRRASWYEAKLAFRGPNIWREIRLWDFPPSLLPFLPGIMAEVW